MNNTDYNLNNLIKIKVRNKPLQMYVQPRFINYYVENDYESFTTELLINYLKEGDTFVDIGAHYGYYSLLASKKKVSSNIISFEPVPENFKVFKKNIVLNKCNNITVYPKAVSNRNGQFTFRISDASDSSGFHGHPQTPTIKKIKIKTIKIDDLKLKKVDLVKIDTEGHEIEVLEGMRRTIRENKNIKLFIEFNPKCLINAGRKPEELLQELNKLGFVNYAIKDNENVVNVIDEKNWTNLVEKGRYVNILCTKADKPIKILFFNHTSGLGGSERSLVELIDEVQQLNAVCRVVLPNKGLICKELENRGIEYQIIEYNWWCSMEKLSKAEQAIRMNNSFANLLERKNLLDQWKPDVVFTNTLTIPWGAIYSLITNKPHMTFIREFGNLDFGFNFFYGFRKTIKFINDYSNYIFTNSKATLLHFEKYINKAKIDYVYAYIDINKRLLSEKSRLIYKGKKSLKLVIVGAVIPTKGHEEVVKAVTTLISRGLDIELAIIGPKHDVILVQKLQKLIKSYKTNKRVKFHDFVINPYPLIKQSDIVIVGSRSEAYGRVTIEAMALRKAVLGTKSGATKELVLDGKTGYLYQPGNYEELAKKIEFLYNRRGKIKELGRNGYLHYKKTFSKEIYGMKVANILKKIKNQKKEDDILTELIKSYQSSTSSTITNLKNDVEALKRGQEALTSEKKSLEIALSKIYSSRTWKMLFYYKKIITGFKQLLNK